MRYWKIVTSISAIMSASISVNDAKRVIEDLDANGDGQLSLFDLVTMLADKVKKAKAAK